METWHLRTDLDLRLTLLINKGKRKEGNSKKPGKKGNEGKWMAIHGALMIQKVILS